MSDTKYILIYPFESRERAFELANDIDGQLMWQNGNAYPRDNVPAFIIPLSEFSSRWTAPRQIEQLQKDKAELIETLEDAITNLPYMPFEDIPEVQEEYRAIAAKHKEDV